jgi:hypothetical protein
MLAEFMTEGNVTSDSPKNRRKLYQHLQNEGIQFKSEIVGYTSGERSLCRWSGNKPMRWNTAVLAKWIAAGRIRADNVRHNTEDPPYYDDYSFDDVEPAFAAGLTRDERETILKQAWDGALSDKDVKWTPFDRCSLYKTIVCITKIGE